jgi:hypothetical protein
MKQPSIKQSVLVGILVMLVAAAAFVLIFTYLTYLPVITWIPVNKSDIGVAQEFYRVARNGFLISGFCGVILGFALPVIFKMFREIYGKHDA